MIQFTPSRCPYWEYTNHCFTLDRIIPRNIPMPVGTAIQVDNNTLVSPWHNCQPTYLILSNSELLTNLNVHVMCHLNIHLTPTSSGTLRHSPAFSSRFCFISLSPFLTICLRHSGLRLFLLYCVRLGAIVSDSVVFRRLLILPQHYS